MDGSAAEATSATLGGGLHPWWWEVHGMDADEVSGDQSNRADEHQRRRGKDRGGGNANQSQIRAELLLTLPASYS